MAIFMTMNEWSHTDALVAVIGFFFGLAYLYFSIRLPKLLREDIATIKWILIVSTAIFGITLLWNLALDSVADAVGCLLGVLINWYLFRNAKRLAAELQYPSTANS